MFLLKLKLEVIIVQLINKYFTPKSQAYELKLIILPMGTVQRLS